MNLKLDHLAVAGATRDDARTYVEEALGLPMQTGGNHARFATHNHLMGLEDNLYLEAISIDPDAPKPEMARWFDLDHFSGSPQLTNWICACCDLEEALSQWPDAGDPVALQRGELRWRMAVPQDGRLPWDNLHPALIEWSGSLHPAQMLQRSGASLRRLTIRHPQATLLADRLQLHDDRIAFEQGAPDLHAVFATPHGVRELA